MKITDKTNNELRLTFMHPQTHGFNPLRVGDILAQIDKDSLLETGRDKILSSALVDENNIIVTVSTPDSFDVGQVVEDVEACPNLTFSNNKMTRIITRGLLITTRGKVDIENNIFESTTMSGILLSDDAKSWYESGMCKDVTIKNNNFVYCGDTPILIKPENTVHRGAVHSNIRIIGNSFKHYDNECIIASSTDNILIKNNAFGKSYFLKTENCSSVINLQKD